MSFCVARQPIFDKRRRVVAYELMFRLPGQGAGDETDADAAARHVIAEAATGAGIESMTAGHPAFLRLTHRTVIEGDVTVLPPAAVVVEVADAEHADPAVVTACRRLKDDGYRLAVRESATARPAPAFAQIADLVKVDAAALREEEARDRIHALVRERKVALAGNVESWAELSRGAELGCTLFEGFFFAEPEALERPSVVGCRSHYLQVLHEVHRQAPEVTRIEAILKRDVSLAWRLLRYVNSPWFSWRTEVRSLRHALVLLGALECRKWATVVALSSLAENRPSELMVVALQRGRFLESLAPLAARGHRADDLFLLGMLSLLPAMTGQPMEVLIGDLPIARDVRAALLGGKGSLRQLLDLCVACERGAWPNMARLAARVGVEDALVAGLYSRALEYADAIADAASPTVLERTA